MLVRLHSLLGLWLGALLALHVYWLWPMVEDRERWVLSTVQRAVSRPLVVTVVLVPLVLHLLLGTLRLRRARPRPPSGAWGLTVVQAATGVLLLVFFGYHLAQVWSIAPGPHSSPRDAYAVLFRDLGRPFDFGIYLLGVSVACFHAGHGLARAAATWGLVRTPRATLLVRLAAGAGAFTLWAFSLQVLAHFVLGQSLVP